MPAKNSHPQKIAGGNQLGVRFPKNIDSESVSACEPDYGEIYNWYDVRELQSANICRKSSAADWRPSANRVNNDAIIGVDLVVRQLASAIAA